MNKILPGSNARGPIVLMYHGTPNTQPSSKYSIRADRFNSHLRYLKKQGWHTALFRELNTASELPEKTVVLTFDDGYADNYEGAFLPLVKNNMKATWFITTDCMGKHASWMGAPTLQTKMLTAGKIQQMATAGMEIGSHTCSHPDLTTLSYQQQVDEMTQSKQILETLIQGKITSFAYPYGRNNGDSLAAAEAAGYQLACTVHPGEFGCEKNPLLVRRITIFANDPASALARKLAFADNDVSWKKMARYYYQRINDKLIGNG